METTKIKIQEKFNQEFENLITTAREIISQSNDPTSYEEEVEKIDSRLIQLRNIGATNSKTVVELNNRKKELKRKIQGIKNNEQWSSVITSLDQYPYKIIDYASLMDVLDKYNLYLGHMRLYEEEIPSFALDEINRYKANLDKQNIFYTEFDLRCSVAENIIRKDSVERKPMNFYIAAPKNHFQKGCLKIDREIVDYKYSDFKEELRRQRMKELDPIVLQPLNLGGDNGYFHNVVAWGEEAKDYRIINELNN